MGAKYRDLVKLHSKARASARAVLNVLANYANDDGVAWPSRATLANDAGMSERNVIRCLQALCEQGRLNLEENGIGGRGRIPHYRILFPELTTTEAVNDAVKGDKKGDKLTEERVTNASIKGDNCAEKGDKCVEIPSYARIEPLEPKEEPILEPVAEKPKYKPIPANFGIKPMMPRKEARFVEGIVAQYQALGMTPSDFTAVVNAILEGKKMRCIADLDTEQGVREHTKAQECALALAAQGYNTPQEITNLFETYRLYDFRGQKGQMPTYESLATHPAELPGLIEASRKNGATNGSNRQSNAARSGQPDGGDTPQLDPDIQRRMDEHRAKRKAEGSRFYQ